MGRKCQYLSIVIPCYNEEESVPRLVPEIRQILGASLEYEIILIDDGSTDRTAVFIESLSEQYSEVKYILFSRNFGKESAMLAGIEYAAGDGVLIMDADMQHPVELIPQMVEIYNTTSAEQVIAKRSRKGEGVRKSIFAKIFYGISSHLMDINLEDGAGDFRLLGRPAVEALLKMDEYNRFSKGMFSWIGFETETVDYDNRVREVGETKWNFKGLLNYALDGIFSFNNSPLRLCLYLGAVLVLLAVLYVVYLFVNILTSGIAVPGYFTTITAVLMVGGVQLIGIGVIGEYVGRIYYEVKKRPHYLIKKSNIGEKPLKKEIPWEDWNG